MPSPRVSVIVPAYNVAAYVEEGLRSVLAQTMPDFEVIVVDDGSTDGTVDAVRALGDARVRLYENGSNRGVSFTRNRALEMARGAWVTPFDPDDLMLPERLERLLAGADAFEADVVADNVWSVPAGATLDLAGRRYGSGSHARPMRRLFSERVEWFDAVSFARGDTLSPLGRRVGLQKPMFRRDFLLRTGVRYDEGIRLAQDVFFYLHCLVAGARWVRLPEAYYVYRERRPGGATTESRTTSTLHRLETSRRMREAGLAAGNAPLERALRHRERQLEHELREAAFLQSRSEGRSLLQAALGAPRNAASHGLRRAQHAYGRARGRLLALRRRLGR